MALIKCKECGGQLGRSAKACPHCGTPNLGWNDITLKKASAAIFFVPLFLVLLVVWIVSGTSSSQIPATAGNDKATQLTPKSVSKTNSKNVVKDDWWSIINHECIHSDKTPETYTKTFPCKIIERQKAKGLVFVKCNFQTAAPGETAEFNTIFANSKKTCDSTLELIRARENAGY